MGQARSVSRAIKVKGELIHSSTVEIRDRIANCTRQPHH